MSPDYFALIVARLNNPALILSTDRFAICKWAEEAKAQHAAMLEALREIVEYDYFAQPRETRGELRNVPDVLRAIAQTAIAKVTA